MAELNTAWQTASAEMYAQSGAQSAQGGEQYNAGGQQNSNKQNDDVQDAEFEEAK